MVLADRVPLTFAEVCPPLPGDVPVAHLVEAQRFGSGTDFDRLPHGRAFSLFAREYFNDTRQPAGVEADLNPSQWRCKRKTTPCAPPIIDKLIDEANCSARPQPTIPGAVGARDDRSAVDGLIKISPKANCRARPARACPFGCQPWLVQMHPS